MLWTLYMQVNFHTGKIITKTRLKMCTDQWLSLRVGYEDNPALKNNIYIYFKERNNILKDKKYYR